MSFQMVSLRLPWPPTMNRYWRHVGAKVLISAEGRAYRETVGGIVVEQGCPSVKGRVRVMVYAFVPDRRQRDLDNLLKATLDALQKASVYENDSQIDDLHIIREDRDEQFPDGSLLVRISEIRLP